MAGVASPAPLPSLSLVFDAVGSSGCPAPLPHLSFVLGKSLTAAAGSYTWTGVAATFTYNRAIAAGTGSFVVSGSATLKAGRKLVAAAGSYTLTGQDATLAKVGATGDQYPAYLPHIGLLLGAPAQYPAYLPHIGLLMAPNSVSYNSTQYPAPLPHLSSIMGSAAGVYSMNAAAGSFTWTGYASTYIHGYYMAADTGSFVLDFSRVARDYQLTGETGSFVLSGQDATVGRHLTLTCDAGSYTLTGNPAALQYETNTARTLTGLGGQFTLTGNDAGYALARYLSAEAGSFTVTGQSASYLFNGYPPVPTPTVGGGKNRRKKHYVEIEGQYYEVRDHEHAVEILTNLQKEAEAAIAKAKAPPKVRAVKPARKDEFAADLQKQIDATNEQLAQMYAQAQEEAELEELMTLGVL